MRMDVGPVVRRAKVGVGVYVYAPASGVPMHELQASRKTGGERQRDRAHACGRAPQTALPPFEAHHVVA